MRIDDLFMKVLDETEKKDYLFLDVSNDKVLSLITSPIKSLYQRLIKGETFTFKDLYKEKEITEENVDLEYLTKDLDLTSLNNHNFYSYEKDAKEILTSFVGKEVYLSFLNITYPSRIRGEVIKAPVFFIKIKISNDNNDEVILSLEDSDPIYNWALINKLKKDFDINIDHPSFVFDVDNYVSYIKSKDVNELITVEEVVSILSLPLKEQNKLWFILQNEEKIKLSPLFNILQGQYTGTKISDEIIRSKDEVIDRFYASLQATFAGIIKTYNKETGKYVLEEIISDYLSSSKSVTIVGDGVNEVADLISKHNLLPLVYDPRGKLNYLNRDSKESLSWVEEEVKDLDFVYDEYSNLYDERRRCFSLPFEEDYKVMAQTIANYTAYGKAKYHFVLDDYSDEELKMDKEFFKKFAKLSSLHSIPLSKHPFYGLTSRADEQTYNEMQTYIKKTLEDLSNFVSKVELLNLYKWDLEPVEAFIDYQRLAKHFTLLKEYEGSFLPYLKMDISDYHEDELEDLIIKFNSISSTRTSIELNVKPSFWNLDLRSILSDLEKKGKEKYARNQILDAEKDPDKKNFPAFVRLIKIYLDNEDAINNIINRFKEINLDVSTLDKAMEVQKAFEFKRNIIAHVRLYDDIDYENNEFFKQFFTDEAMRENLKTNIIPPLEEISNQLTLDFDALRTFFDSGEQKDYETLPFNKVKNYLEKISNASYKVYNDYYNFVLNINETSLPLKNVIDKLIEEDKNFDYLEVEYFASLFSAYKDVANKANIAAENDIRPFKPIWRNSLSVVLEEERKKKINLTFASIKEYLNSVTYRATSREIKRYTYTYDYLHNVSMIKKYNDVIRRTHPIHLINKTDHYDRLFATDVTIITNFNELSIFDLLELIAISKVFIIINSDNDASLSIDDKEVLINSFVPETVYDLANLFKSIDYTVIDTHLFNLLEYNANRLGYKLVRDYQVGKEKYPLCLLRPGKETPSYVLFPDLGMIGNREEVLKASFPILVSIYNAVPIELPVLLSSLLPKEILRFAVEPVATIKEEEEEVKEVVKPTNISEKKAKYLNKLEEIRSSFTVKNNIKTLEPVDEEYVLYCLPFNETELEESTPEFKAVFNDLVEVGKIYKEGNIYHPANKKYISLHKDSKEKVYREELLQGVFKYISSFTYLPYDTLKEEITSVLGVEQDDLFILGEINMVLHELFKDKKILIEGNKLSLFKTK